MTFLPICTQWLNNINLSRLSITLVCVLKIIAHACQEQTDVCTYCIHVRSPGIHPACVIVLQMLTSLSSLIERRTPKEKTCTILMTRGIFLKDIYRIRKADEWQLRRISSCSCGSSKCFHWKVGPSPFYCRQNQILWRRPRNIPCHVCGMSVQKYTKLTFIRALGLSMNT